MARIPTQRPFGLTRITRQADALRPPKRHALRMLHAVQWWNYQVGCQNVVPELPENPSLAELAALWGPVSEGLAVADEGTPPDSDFGTPLWRTELRELRRLAHGGYVSHPELVRFFDRYRRWLKFLDEDED